MGIESAVNAQRKAGYKNCIVAKDMPVRFKRKEKARKLDGMQAFVSVSKRLQAT
jgi:hypothetical protein